MFDSILQKMKPPVISFRMSLLVIFISFFTIAIISLITITYFRFSKNITSVAFTRMKQQANAAFITITHESNNVAAESRFTADLIKKNILDKNNKKEIVDYLFSLLKMGSEVFPSLQSVLWGDKNGSIFVLNNLGNGNVGLAIINREHSPIVSEQTLWNSQGNKIKYSITKTDYDARLRSWFITAKERGQFTWTSIYSYLFFDKGYLGMSAVTPVFNAQGIFSGVVALNIRLDYLENFVENISVSKHGLLFIVAKNGRIIAFPHLPEASKKSLTHIQGFPISWIAKSFDEYKKNGKTEFLFLDKEKKYLAVYKTLPSFFPHEWLVGVVAPENDFVRDLKKTNQIIIGLSLLILAIGIFSMSLLIGYLTKPLKKITNEIDKIRRFDLSDSPKIISKIKEVYAITNAFNGMKKSLVSFKKYVPETLVQQLVTTGEVARVGGVKKKLAVFFTDIRNFTTIVEQIKPNQVMSQLCDYFSELSGIITSHQGTIDKFIGDAVMAFWGAPLPVENSCRLAAEAALQCQRRLNLVNAKWKAEGKMAFLTRIGIHVGEVIVGNVGSSEHLNYTAIGDVINVASRLESINKLYGSEIIVSEAVFLEIRDQFILRMLDLVTLKGKVEANYIYELLGEKNARINFDTEKYSVFFSRGFKNYQKKNWDEAIKYFLACLKIYPEDHVAVLFIKRIEQFIKTPPSSDWDGIWHLSEK